jgi:hypothetical protein
VFIHYQTGAEMGGGEVIRLFQQVLGRNPHTEMLFAGARAPGRPRAVAIGNLPGARSVEEHGGPHPPAADDGRGADRTLT